MSPGLPNVDVMVYLIHDQGNDCGATTGAWCSACAWDSTTNRPIAMTVNVCKGWTTNVGGKTLKVNLDVMLHEIIHGLGFSSNEYEYFLDENKKLSHF